MKNLLETAEPIEVAALWRLGDMRGDDIAAVCVRWLEADLDQGDADIAALAGEAGLSLHSAGPAFERGLSVVVGRSVGRDEAILRALRLYLAKALDEENIVVAAGLVLQRFKGLSDKRLVRHPWRERDRADEYYAEQELGLEYLYGGYHELDDIFWADPSKREAAEAEQRAALRSGIEALHGRLSAMLATGRLSDL